MVIRKCVPKMEKGRRFLPGALPRLNTKVDYHADNTVVKTDFVVRSVRMLCARIEARWVEIVRT
jgi:hypothetical protein